MNKEELKEMDGVIMLKIQIENKLENYQGNDKKILIQQLSGENVYIWFNDSQYCYYNDEKSI